MGLYTLRILNLYRFKQISIHALLTTALLLPAVSTGQERWFQIEVSIFSNESLSDRAEEYWATRPGQLRYPANLQRLQGLMDILTIDSLLIENSPADQDIAEESSQEREDRLRRERIAAVGPHPAIDSQQSNFKFFDFARDSFLQLPPNQSNFQQTNRALERSADHRLLFHGLWRQAVENSASARPIHVSGGNIFGETNELEGSLTIRFNDNRDRVVIDADIWLTEYSTVPLPNAQWEIPIPPSTENEQQLLTSSESDQYYPVQVYHMQQSREMRSTEFHYLDHPALGIVVLVEPYELPVLPPQGFEIQSVD